MVPVARRNLLAEPTRLLISVGGVAFAVLLMLVIQSLYQGFARASGSFIAGLPADVWVVQYGATDLSHTASFLPAEVGTRLAQIDGVKDITPVLARRMTVAVGGETASIFLFATDRSLAGSGGIRVVEGKPVPGAGEVLLDTVFARKYGSDVGDQISIGTRQLTVSGIFSGGNSIVSQFAFVTPGDALAVFGQPGLVNYFLVTVKGGQDSGAVAADIQRLVPGTSVYTAQGFVKSNQQFVVEVFLPVIAVLTFIAFLVGTAVVGLTIYTATIEKTREFGLMKAIGAAPGYLYRVVLAQSLIIGVLGFGVGVVAALGVNALANQVVPEFITVLRWVDALWILAAALAMALLATYLPIRRVAAADPALVFRA